MKNTTHTLYYRAAVAVLVATTMLSCKKLIRIDPPVSQLTVDKIFIDDNSAAAAISNLYTWLENYNIEANLMPYISLYADEVYPTTADQESMVFYNNAIPVDDANIANIWKYAYFIIYESNAILENLPAAKGVTPDVKKQILGEAGFLRALAYYFLVNLYGDVPLVLSADIKEAATLPRAPAADIYKQIIKDLTDAENKLTESYPDGGKIRANKWCATALLARIYLYTGDWKNAEAKSTEVISSGEYKLVSLNQVFTSNNEEALLQCWNQKSYTITGSTYLPGSADEVPLYGIDTALLNAFEPGDGRKAEWLDSVAVSGMMYYYPYKYQMGNGSGGDRTEYTTLLRLGEQYLIRAEARVHQNDLAGAEKDLNILRRRAGLKGINGGLSQAALLTEVAHERQTELFTEWGHRFFDLKRTGRINAVLGSEKPFWKSRGQFFPIPQSELDKNPHLTQNEGY